MEDIDHIRYMSRALDLARMGEGNTSPNPMVGAVIVHNNRIIGEGYHRKAGNAHAEVIAINSVKEKGLLKDSTIYVTLEPCSHVGKTPPCADLIIKSSIPRVVVGTVDTSSKVSGRGIIRLREHGCVVTTGMMDKEARELNRRFFSFHEKKRPWVILKWACSEDGFLDAERPKGHPREPLWITGEEEKILVHKWRSEEDAILVGAGTVRSDNPLLNVRHWTGRNPVKVIVSSSGTDLKGSTLFETDGRIILFSNNELAETPGVKVVCLDSIRSMPEQVCSELYNEQILSVFVEGGASVLNQYISSGVWDEIRVFRGKKPFGKGLSAPEPNGLEIYRKDFQTSTLRIYRNTPLAL